MHFNRHPLHRIWSHEIRRLRMDVTLLQASAAKIRYIRCFHGKPKKKYYYTEEAVE